MTDKTSRGRIASINRELELIEQRLDEISEEEAQLIDHAQNLEAERLQLEAADVE